MLKVLTSIFFHGVCFLSLSTGSCMRCRTSRVVCFPRETPLEESKFSLQVVISQTQFLGQEWGMCPLLLLALGPHLVQTCAGPVLAASVSVSSYKLCSVDLEGLVLLVYTILSCHNTFSASFSIGFPEFQGKGFDGSILSRAMCSKVSHSLCHVWL